MATSETLFVTRAAHRRSQEVTVDHRRSQEVSEVEDGGSARPAVLLAGGRVVAGLLPLPSLAGTDGC